MGELVRFPSPMEDLRGELRLRYGYLWEHDFLAPEYRKLGLEARIVYVHLCLLANDETQEAEVGLRQLATAAGLVHSTEVLADGRPAPHFQNCRRAILELEAAKLIAVRRDVVGTIGRDGRMKRKFGRSRYVLLEPPSVLQDPRVPAQVPLALPFRRLNSEEFWLLKRARSKRG